MVKKKILRDLLLEFGIGGAGIYYGKNLKEDFDRDSVNQT